MTSRNIGLSDDLHAYVVAHCGVTDEVTRDLIEETRSVLPAQFEMQIAPDQAALVTLLTRLVNAKRAVEVGTFTGMSALAIARGLPDDGTLHCFDISTEYTSVAERYWQRAGVAKKIDLRIGPAAERLAELPVEPIDNVLRGGRVVAPETADDRAIVAFNDAVRADERVDSVLLPLADGLTVARKR